MNQPPDDIHTFYGDFGGGAVCRLILNVTAYMGQGRTSTPRVHWFGDPRPDLATYQAWRHDVNSTISKLINRAHVFILQYGLDLEPPPPPAHAHPHPRPRGDWYNSTDENLGYSILLMPPGSETNFTAAQRRFPTNDPTLGYNEPDPNRQQRVPDYITPSSPTFKRDLAAWKKAHGF